MDLERQREYEAMVVQVEPRLRRGLVATYGFEQGREATLDALSWAWEHWDRAKRLKNLAAYLYRVGQSPFAVGRSPSPSHESRLRNCGSSRTWGQRCNDCPTANGPLLS